MEQKKLMMKTIKSNYQQKKLNKCPPGPYENLTIEERMDIIANIIIDRTLEEESLYRERLKTDPNAKRIFDLCECDKCKAKRAKEFKKIKNKLANS